MHRHIITVVAFVALFSAGVAAQSLSELMQRGIYTQETLGDVDAAIRIYQQVILAAAQAADIRAQAERRLKSLQALQAQRRVPSLPPTGAFETVPDPSAPRGSFDGRTYRHTWSGTTFAVPEGWTFHGDFPSSDSGEMATFGSKDPETSVAVWMIKEETDPAGVSAKLENAPIQKISQREGFAGWHYREGSVHRVNIGGHQAVVATADYTLSDRKMAEYMTWIYTEHSRVFFFVRLPAEELERIRPQFDRAVHSAVIP